MMDDTSVRCISIMGATATGKSGLGIRLARAFDGEVVSMDSRQVYRGLDIGTGKVTAEECNGIPHHLLDILDPGETGSAGGHARKTREIVADISGRGRVPFLVGGTGLYFDALLRPLIDVTIDRDTLARIRAGFDTEETDRLYRRLAGVDPDRAAQLSPNDRIRITRALEIYEASGVPMSRHLAEQRQSGSGGPTIESLNIVLTMPRETLRERIAERTRGMFEAGWPDEVRALLKAGYTAGSPGLQSLGYAEIARAVEKGTDPADAVDAVITRTHQYAKRQETWFRRESDATWLDVTRADCFGAAAGFVARFLGRDFNKHLT
jgi:tRNA dimethylallyltransferase